METTENLENFISVADKWMGAIFMGQIDRLDEKSPKSSISTKISLVRINERHLE